MRQNYILPRVILKAVLFIERFYRTFPHIINKPMFINGDGNWANILNDNVVTKTITFIQQSI